jgi:hypothetical protein
VFYSSTTYILLNALHCTALPCPAGEDEAEQLACIMEVLGTPPPELLERASRRKLFFDGVNTPKLTPNSQGKLHHPGEKGEWGQHGWFILETSHNSSHQVV